jgi:hypothetical protein
LSSFSCLCTFLSLCFQLWIQHCEICTAGKRKRKKKKRTWNNRFFFFHFFFYFSVKVLRTSTCKENQPIIKKNPFSNSESWSIRRKSEKFFFFLLVLKEKAHTTPIFKSNDINKFLESSCCNMFGAVFCLAKNERCIILVLGFQAAHNFGAIQLKLWQDKSRRRAISKEKRFFLKVEMKEIFHIL